MLSGLRIKDKGPPVISSKELEEDTTVAAMDEPETNAIYFETMIYSAEPLGFLRLISPPLRGSILGMTHDAESIAAVTVLMLSASSKMFCHDLPPNHL